MTSPKGGGRKTTGNARNPAEPGPTTTPQAPQPQPTIFSDTDNDPAAPQKPSLHRPPLAVWLRPSQVQLVAEITRLAGLTITLAGSPDTGRSASVADLLRDQLSVNSKSKTPPPDAQHLGSAITPIDDIRTLISRAEPGSIVLLASIARFGTDGDRADLRLLAAAADRGVRVLSFEPIPASVAHLVGTDHARRGSGVRGRSDTAAFAEFGSVRRTPDWWSAVGHDAIDLVSHVGSPCALAVESIAPHDHGSLSARLLDACTLIVGLLGQPELVDAALAPANFAGGSIHLAADTLGPDLHGTITLNARYADGRAASAIASNAADVWKRNATLLTTAGAIIIDDAHARSANDHTPRSTHDRADATTTPSTPTSVCASLIARHINQIILRAESQPQQQTSLLQQHQQRQQLHQQQHLHQPIVGHPQAVVADVARSDSARSDTTHDQAETAAIERAALALAEAALLSTRTGEPECPATIERLAAAVIGV